MGCVYVIIEGLKWRHLANKLTKLRGIERISILAEGFLFSRLGFGIMGFVTYKPSIIL